MIITTNILGRYINHKRVGVIYTACAINKIDHTPLAELSVTPTDKTLPDMSQLNVCVSTAMHDSPIGVQKNDNSAKNLYIYSINEKRNKNLDQTYF